MSTYSAHRRVTSSDHPLNGGLGGYCQGQVPRVSRVADYSQKFWIRLVSLQWQMAGEPYTPYQDMDPPLWAEEEGPPT
jgi:hypothetical protein